MGSPYFLSEAAIDDDSEKCYLPCLMLPAIAQPRSQSANLLWHFWLAFAPGDSYRLLSHDLRPFNSEYIYSLLINTLNHFFLNKSLVCSLEAM